MKLHGASFITFNGSGQKLLFYLQMAMQFTVGPLNQNYFLLHCIVPPPPNSNYVPTPMNSVSSGQQVQADSAQVSHN